jgi:hypothetical protein
MQRHHANASLWQPASISLPPYIIFKQNVKQTALAEQVGPPGKYVCNASGIFLKTAPLHVLAYPASALIVSVQATWTRQK